MTKTIFSSKYQIQTEINNKKNHTDIKNTMQGKRRTNFHFSPALALRLATSILFCALLSIT